MSKVLIVTANYYKDISNGLYQGASNILNKNDNWLRSHLVILTLKLLLYSIIIGLFILLLETSIWSILIISGMLNIVSFHFLEVIFSIKMGQ